MWINSSELCLFIYDLWWATVHMVITFLFYKMRGNFLNNFLLSQASHGKRMVAQTFHTCLQCMRPCTRDERVIMYCKSSRIYMCPRIYFTSGMCGCWVGWSPINKEYLLYRVLTERCGQILGTRSTYQNKKKTPYQHVSRSGHHLNLGFYGFSQSLQTCAEIVPRLYHDHFLS
jgi:hypothetical protein